MTNELNLWTAQHNGVERSPISETQTKTLVAAFGRFGGAKSSREAAVPFIRETQNSGRWIFCSCRKGALLIPYEHEFVHRRHHKSPAHDDNCPFSVEPVEQFAISRSMQPQPRNQPFNLLRAFAEDRDAPRATTGDRNYSSVTPNTRRPRLAKLLMSLLEKSGVQKRASGDFNVSDQFRSIAKQAEDFFLVKNVPVSSMLCRYAADYKQFITEFDNKAAGFAWPNGTRPHAIALAVAAGIDDNKLILRKGDPIELSGSISIFGRSNAPVTRSSTYLAIAIIGKPHPGDKPTILETYLHPCRSTADLMLVDSNYERETFRELRILQLEFRDRIRIDIEKPLFDMSLTPHSDHSTLEQDRRHVEQNGSHPVLIPDFIVRFPDLPVRWRADIIVETMGFSWRTYRTEKATIIPKMRAALGGIGHVEHDFHFPANVPQSERNDALKDDLRKRIGKRLEAWLREAR